MDRNGVSEPAPRPDRRGKLKKGPRGLRVKARDGYWYLIGTIRVAGRSQRIRQSTGLPATPECWQAADDLRVRAEGQARQEAIHGTRPSVPFSIAAERFLSKPRSRPLHYLDVQRIQELTRHFGTRMLDEISEQDWNAFVDKRQAGNQPQTRERYLNIVVAFLNFCFERPQRYIREVPAFNRDASARNIRQRSRRRVTELTHELVICMVEHAPPHLRGQLAVEWSTGGRVSSILFNCRLCDLILAKGREQITFHNTKNGKSVVAALTPWAAEQMRAYIEWRGKLSDREGPLFLTHLRKPYSEKSSIFSGQNKTAFRGMKARAAAAIRQAGQQRAADLTKLQQHDAAQQALEEVEIQAGLIEQVTQHWFRHRLATKMNAEDADLRSIMAQGGWDDPKSVLGYIHDVPEVRRAKVNLLEAPDLQPAKTGTESDG